MVDAPHEEAVQVAAAADTHDATHDKAQRAVISERELR